jgi:hypothetical protein
MRRVLTPALIDRFRRYNEEHPTWGSMHAILEDQNLLDSDVEWAATYAAQTNDYEGAILADILRDFTPAGRFLIAELSDFSKPRTIQEAIAHLNDAFQYRTLDPEDEYGIIGQCIACHRNVEPDPAPNSAPG